MKKTGKTVSFLLIFALLCGAISVVVPAKDLEPCYHCNSTGRYHCPECGDTGEVTCDGCGGAGYTECPGEEGKGKCDNGYYLCPACKGTGYALREDGSVDETVRCGYNRCVNGKVECWHCHGNPHIVCDRCGGDGKCECQILDCKEARKVGGKCHYCMGAGYMLTNFWPGENDGVQNKPVKGDKIWVDGKSYDYGEGPGGSGGQGGTTQPGTDPPGGQTDPPAAGEKHSLDLGSGVFQVGDKTVLVWIDGKTESGTVEIEENVAIRLENFDPETMRVRVYGENQFSVELPVDERGEVYLGRIQEGFVLSGGPLGLVVELREDRGDPGPVTGPGGVPEDRTSDFDVADNGLSSARVEIGRMTEEEQRRYAALSGEELSKTVETVRIIVASAQPGRSDEATDALMEKLAADNGFDSLRDGRFYPIYFEGHAELGFPIRVTVALPQGELDGGRDLYVYHQTDSGVVPLGKAEYGTFEDGSVQSISFYTDGFSTFFTSAASFGPIENAAGAAAKDTRDPSAGLPLPLIIGIAAAGAAALAATVFVLVKKKKKS